MRMRKLRSGQYILLTLIGLNVLLLIFLWKRCYTIPLEPPIMVRDEEERIVIDEKTGNRYRYGTESPLIFVGGVPRSGTTLMRAMLDAHPEVRCGEETRVVPRILGLRQQWKNSKKESNRLIEAGLTDDVIDSAISSFILEVIVRHGQPASRLCNKDPFTLKSAEYLSKLFPKAKFIMMIRDGRATVHSIISRKVTITGFDLTNYRQCLEKWNQAISVMYHQCYLVEQQLRAVLEFLDIPWNSSVLHHEMFIGKEISLSKTERSTDQVVKPVNIDALSTWVGKLPEDVVRDMPKIAPMLAHLGYDPLANPPDYGKADEFVLDNTKNIHRNENFWRAKISEVYNSSDPRKEGGGAGSFEVAAAGASVPLMSDVTTVVPEVPKARRRRRLL